MDAEVREAQEDAVDLPDHRLAGVGPDVLAQSASPY